MSGSATQDDPSNYAVWTFHSGAITRGLCHIDVYVPDDPNIEHVGGHPAVYEVFNSDSTFGQPRHRLVRQYLDSHAHCGIRGQRHLRMKRQPYAWKLAQALGGRQTAPVLRRTACHVSRLAQSQFEERGRLRRPCDRAWRG